MTLLEVDVEQARALMDPIKTNKDLSVESKINVTKYLANAEQSSIRAFAASRAKNISIQLQSVEFLVDCSCLFAIHENLGQWEVERRINTYSNICYEALTRCYGEKNMNKAIE